jgi:hypothetical protein
MDKQSPEMLSRLGQLMEDLRGLHSKLILLVGVPHAGKTSLLRAFGERVNASPLNVGAELGQRLAAVPQRQRHLQVGTILHELADGHALGDLLLIDNIELLFDPALQLDPLALLKRHARTRRVVAVWPGELSDGRLTYADVGHPEQRDYGTEGLVPLNLQ